MCQVNGKADISTPHSSHIFQPILTKLETKKDIRGTTPHAKFGWCGTTGMGLRKKGIFRYFLCSILFCILAHAYSSHQKTDHDRLWLKTRASA